MHKHSTSTHHPEIRPGNTFQIPGTNEVAYWPDEHENDHQGSDNSPPTTQDLNRIHDIMREHQVELGRRIRLFLLGPTRAKEIILRHILIGILLKDGPHGDWTITRAAAHCGVSRKTASKRYQELKCLFSS